jgi:hypothetical protein
MPTETVKPGDALNAIAARIFPGEDVSRFTEILDQIENPDEALNTLFSDLVEGTNLQLPSLEQIESFAQPVLSKVASSLGGAKGVLDQATEIINSVSGKLPPQLQGYAADALNVVGEANGVLSKAESILGEAEGKLRDYGGQATNLVPWLLSGKV